MAQALVSNVISPAGNVTGEAEAEISDSVAHFCRFCVELQQRKLMKLKLHDLEVKWVCAGRGHIEES